MSIKLENLKIGDRVEGKYDNVVYTATVMDIKKYYRSHSWWANLKRDDGVEGIGDYITGYGKGWQIFNKPDDTWGADETRGELTKILPKEFIISTPTRELYNKVMRKLEGEGYMWYFEFDKGDYCFGKEHCICSLNHKDMNYKLGRSTRKWLNKNHPNIPITPAEEYLGIKTLTVCDGSEKWKTHLFQDRMMNEMIDNLRLTAYPPLNDFYGTLNNNKPMDNYIPYTDWKYNFKPFYLNNNKPKSKKIMSIIKNAFKGKRQKALEYYYLVNEEGLKTQKYKEEYLDYVIETGDTKKENFEKKIEEVYIEETKKK